MSKGETPVILKIHGHIRMDGNSMIHLISMVAIETQAYRPT